MKQQSKEIEDKIMCEVDDGIYKIKKDVQKKFKLSWEKARDGVNESIKILCCDCWNENKRVAKQRTNNLK